MHVTDPEDYIVPAPFSVTFSPADSLAGVVMRCLNITVVDDADVECVRDFTVGIESISPAVSTDLSSNITVNIDDSADGKSATQPMSCTLFLGCVCNGKLCGGTYTIILCTLPTINCCTAVL